MRDNDDDAMLSSQRFNCVDKRILAFGIEIGIWLVEHDQKRTAEYGSRQTNSLTLPGRQ